MIANNAVSRECNSTAESTFDVNVSRELQLELGGDLGVKELCYNNKQIQLII